MCLNYKTLLVQAQVADRESQLLVTQEREGEVRRQCSQRLAEVQSRAGAVRALHTTQLDKERQALRETRHELELKLTDLEGDLASQRDEITSHFEQIIRERDSENELRTRDLRTALATIENKYRESVRELEACKAVMASLTDEAKAKTEELLKAEKEVRERQWALEDHSNEQEARVRELQRRLTAAETQLGKQGDEFARRYGTHTHTHRHTDTHREYKRTHTQSTNIHTHAHSHSEMDRRLREKESILKSAREAHCRKLGDVEEVMTGLTRELETRDSTLRTLQQHQEELFRQKQAELDK